MSDFAAELHAVLALNPANRIVELKHVVGKLRVAAIIQEVFIWGASKFHAGESRILHPGESNFRWIILPQAVGHFTAETAAETE